jgi:microcystin-dependent protein
MSTRFNRPSSTYAGAPALTNRDLYQQRENNNQGRDPAIDDGQLNYLTDALNQLDEDIAGVAAGSIPGATDPANANKVVKSTGSGIVLSFVDNSMVSDGSLALSKLATGTAGAVLVRDNTGLVTNAGVGTAGQVLASNGAGLAPSMQSVGSLPGVRMIGEMVIWPAPVIPTGWLECDGRALSRTTYADLFAAIGTTWGTGDGSTTFNIPDMRGRTPVGKDNMGGTAANRITNAICSIVGTLLGAVGGDERMQQHNHGVTDPGHDHMISGVNATASAGPLGGRPWVSGDDRGPTKTNTTGISIQNAGAGSSQNVQPSAIVNFIIRVL